MSTATHQSIRSNSPRPSTPHRHYILDDDGNPKPVDRHVWTAWYARAVICGSDIIRYDRFSHRSKFIIVETVFTGINEMSECSGPPYLFKTSITGGGSCSGYVFPSRTKSEAIDQHMNCMRMARGEAR